MGHANLGNLSTFFVRRLYAKGKLSVSECADAALVAGEKLHAGEGEITEPSMLRYALEMVVRHLSGRFERDYTPAQSHQVIEPILDTPEKKRIYQRWLVNDEDGWDPDGDDGEYGTLDSIQWRFAEGWRRKYPETPVLGYVET